MISWTVEVIKAFIQDSVCQMHFNYLFITNYKALKSTRVWCTGYARVVFL